ncbi:MAG: hypothetical protein SH850_23390 [Planctomycetaceae bacterium]|nr:hypothetical protein [Planctomycetaceae bacterium]
MQHPSDQRAWWLVAGVVIGVGLSYLWPLETAQGVATDREERFAICTTDSGIAQPESVFVLDFLTGRLTGATLNAQTATFTSFYFRMIGPDFLTDANAKPKFVIIPGRAELNSRGGTTTSPGVLYIAELTSGKVIAYRYTIRNSRTPLPPQPMEPFATFPFREATAE